MELKKQLRKKLVETKETKEKKLIQEVLIKNRFINAVESVDNVINYKNLSKKKQIDLSVDLLEEIADLSEEGLINENLGDILGSLFGSSWSGLLQTMAEPLVNSILSGLGMEDGYFKNTLVSFFTKNPMRLAQALRGNCKELTGLVVESIIEGIEMKLLNDRGMSSGGWVFLRNAVNDAIHGSEFAKSLENSLENTICQLFSKFTGKASEVVDKLKKPSSLIDTAKSAVQSAITPTTAPATAK